MREVGHRHFELGRGHPGAHPQQRLVHQPFEPRLQVEFGRGAVQRTNHVANRRGVDLQGVADRAHATALSPVAVKEDRDRGRVLVLKEPVVNVFGRFEELIPEEISKKGRINLETLK